MTTNVIRDAHLNLVQSSRQLFELDPGVAIEAGPGWLFGAGSSSHPTISNAAFRTDDGLDPGELIERARDFFAPRKRGFALWARVGVPADEGLLAAAQRAGLEQVYEMPAMVLAGKTKLLAPPADVELTQVASQAEATDFWQVATEAYASNGFPQEVFAHYENHEGLTAANVTAFLARFAGRPAGISMTILSHELAGIYWVGSIPEARGRGLGRAVTAAAVAAGYEMGAESASLQASPMGEGIYRQMGFETIYRYRLFLSRPPANR